MFRGWSRVRSRLPVCLLGHRPRIRRPAPAPAGSGRGCCTRAQPRPGGVVNMECGLAGPAPPSWGVTCPCLLKACFSNNRCIPGSITLKDKGARAEKVRTRCDKPLLSTAIKDGYQRESDGGGLSANPAQIMSSFLRIGPITAAMGLIHGLMTKVGSN